MALQQSAGGAGGCFFPSIGKNKEEKYIGGGDGSPPAPPAVRHFPEQSQVVDCAGGANFNPRQPPAQSLEFGGKPEAACSVESAGGCIPAPPAPPAVPPAVLSDLQRAVMHAQPLPEPTPEQRLAQLEQRAEDRDDLAEQLGEATQELEHARARATKAERQLRDLTRRHEELQRDYRALHHEAVESGAVVNRGDCRGWMAVKRPDTSKRPNPLQMPRPGRGDLEPRATPEIAGVLFLLAAALVVIAALTQAGVLR